MITRIEALNYRCLRYVSQSLGPFHVLVGPNASGKTTFLDVVALLHDVVSGGPADALAARTSDPRDLLFARTGAAFEVAIEARIPEEKRKVITRPEMDTVRYELSLGADKKSGDCIILAEKLLMFASPPASKHAQRDLFPCPPTAPVTILSPKSSVGTKTILNKVLGGNDNFQPETEKEKGKRWVFSFKLGPTKSTLGNLPEDEQKFPVATWFRDLLGEGVQRFVLNSVLMRQASAPMRTKGFLPDGSNLPWVVETLKTTAPEQFASWIKHLQTALEDLDDIRTVELPDTKHRFMMFKYRGGIEIPSWVASDGTLRLMALTLPAYLTDFRGIYLIEEPENGIHPRAVATVYDSLSSVYAAQVLLASHSPVVLNAAKPKDVLCFAKNTSGATDVILGSEHPKLREWKGEVKLGTLLAAGVLG